MSLIDVALVKRHLRVDFTDDDTEIEAYQAAAEAIVKEYVDREIYAAGEGASSGDDGTAIEVTAPITAAILLLVGDMYEHRESDTWESDMATLPRTVRALLAPYRVWRTLDEDTYVAVTT